jgi:hypothetical protein
MSMNKMFIGWETTFDLNAMNRYSASYGGFENHGDHGGHGGHGDHGDHGDGGHSMCSMNVISRQSFTTLLSISRY